LAGGSPHEKVDCSNVVGSDRGEVAEIRDLGIVMRENRAGKGVDV
jgi:hypothetical protein